jgi:hypothetical protein
VRLSLPAVLRVGLAERSRREYGCGQHENAEPVGGANGDEPFSSVSIATSAAAHPRRSPLTFGCVRCVWVFSVLSVTPWLFFTTEAQRPQRVLKSDAEGGRFVFVYFACFAVTLSSGAAWEVRRIVVVFWSQRAQSRIGLVSRRTRHAGVAMASLVLSSPTRARLLSRSDMTTP